MKNKLIKFWVLLATIIILVTTFSCRAASSIYINLHKVIESNAYKYQLPPAVIASIINIESNADTCARSSAGAEGIMQFIPKTALSFNLSDPYEPGNAVMAGTLYLKKLLVMANGNFIDMAAMYNHGPRAKYKSFQKLPIETKNYITKFMLLLGSDKHWKSYTPLHVLNTTRSICESLSK